MSNLIKTKTFFSISCDIVSRDDGLRIIKADISCT